MEISFAGIRIKEGALSECITQRPEIERVAQIGRRFGIPPLNGKPNYISDGKVIVERSHQLYNRDRPLIEHFSEFQKEECLSLPVTSLCCSTALRWEDEAGRVRRPSTCDEVERTMRRAQPKIESRGPHRQPTPNDQRPVKACV